MFGNTVTIPQQINNYVEKVNWEYKYDDIINTILINNSNNIYALTNNNIIGDDYVMSNREYIKSFNELYDAKNNKIVVLSKRVDFIISSDEDGFYYSNKLYNVFSYGENQKEVEDKLFEEIKFQYDSYAFEDDNNLDSNAQRLKNNLLSLFDINA